MRFVFLLSVLLLLFGLLMNPALLTRYLSPDHSINIVNLFLIRLTRATALTVGCALILGGALLHRYKRTWFDLVNKATINLFLIFASTLSTLAVTEVLLQHIDPYGLNFFKYSRTYFSDAIRKSEILDLKYEHRPLYKGSLAKVWIEINSKKLREFEYPYEKPEGVYRILCLGDSVTFGWGVPFEKTFPKRLERLLNDSAPSQTVQVINTGVGGYNTGQEAAYLRAEGIKYHPDLILLLFSVKDANETQVPLKPVVVPAKVSVTWMLKMSPISVVTRLCPSIFGLYYYVTMPRVDYFEDFRQGENTGWRRCQDSLMDIVKTGESNGASTVVFMVPARQGLDEKYPFEAIHQTVGEFCVQHQIAFFDLLPAFRNLPNKAIRISVFDGHPNEFAHGIIARSVFEDLNQSGLCRRGKP